MFPYGWVIREVVRHSLWLFAVCGLLAAPALHVQEVQFIDREGFERPLVAQKMMVPAGWRVQAVVKWTGARCGTPYYLEMQAQAPDGIGAMIVSRGEVWAQTSMPLDDGCRHAGITTAEQYLRDWVQRNRPGSRWLDYRLRPERSMAPQQNGNGSMMFRNWGETGQALIGYTVNGQAVRESLLVSATFTASQTSMGGMVARTLHGESKGVLAWRMPEGQLDFQKFDVIWNTMVPGYEWSLRIAEGRRQMAADNARTNAAISRIYGEMGMETIQHMAKRGEDARLTREQLQATWNSGVAARDSAEDRMQRERIRAIRQVEHYSDPTRPTGVAELPNHYKHAWSLRDGSYALTDDPNFNPNRDLGVEGRLLRLAPR